MPRFQYVVLAQAVAGREQEFDDWYDGQHIADVQRVPGVVSARRCNVVFQKVYDLAAPRYHSLAIYEIETDDPEAFLAGISKLSGTPAMPSSSALDKQGMIQIVGLPIEQGPTTT
jgi:hypothetical protein